MALTKAFDFGQAWKDLINKLEQFRVELIRVDAEDRAERERLEAQQGEFSQEVRVKFEQVNRNFARVNARIDTVAVNLAAHDERTRSNAERTARIENRLDSLRAGGA